MSPAHDAALVAARRLLRPLASFMLKCGLTCREFTSLAKTAFVTAATEDYGIKGRPTNISRVALLTGLARKEVKRQRDLMEMAKAMTPVEKTTDATRLLSGWHQDPDFMGGNSNPRDLSLEDFDALCRRYCSDVPASAMLKELKRVNAVAENGDELKVLSRYYMPTQADPQWVMTAGDYLADLNNTIKYNVDCEADAPRRFVGRAHESRIPKNSVDEFHRFMEGNGQQFLEKVDAWLAEHQTTEADTANSETVRLGTGVFLIQDEVRMSNDKTNGKAKDKT